MDIKFLVAEDLHLLESARDVFDNPIVKDVAERFLSDANHHIAVAIIDSRVVGFISAVRYDHPDKRAPELWINELGVADDQQRMGIGRELIHAMLQKGKTVGCHAAWVLADRDNATAIKFYAAVNCPVTPSDAVMFSFDLGDLNKSE